MQHQFYIPKGKVTYFINGVKFQNSKKSRDGLEKANAYCLANMLDTKKIMKFDSDLECNRYEYLLELEKEGKINDLNYHYKLLVQQEFINANGDSIPAITYCADFIYKDLNLNKRVVEDVKGYSLISDTRFEIEKQLFDHNFLDKGLYIKVIIYRNKEWIEWHIGDKKTEGKALIKQRNKIHEQNKVLHDKEIHDNKISRLKATREKYMALTKLTNAQIKRLNEINDILKNEGYIL